MKGKRNICILALSLAVSLLFWARVGICCPTYEISEIQLSTLETELNALAENNEELLIVLSESQTDLNEAREQLVELKQKLAISAANLATLRADLQKSLAEANAARQSLQIAQKELDDAAKSLKASEAAHGKTEGRLRTQRNIWEALFFIACGVAATR